MRLKNALPGLFRTVSDENNINPSENLMVRDEISGEMIAQNSR